MGPCEPILDTTATQSNSVPRMAVALRNAAVGCCFLHVEARFCVLAVSSWASRQFVLALLLPPPVPVEYLHRRLNILSYSSWVPIQNQKKTSPWSRASAR